MGLMRALTTSRRSFIARRTTSTSTITKSRPQISLPTELISTTNMLSYTAPSVESMQAAALQALSSQTSPYQSNRPSFAASDEPSLTDDSSHGSDSSPSSPEPRARPEYFQQSETFPLGIKTDSMVSVLDMDDVSPTTLLPAPALPRRAASHSKHEHVRLARCRSRRATSLGPLSTSSSLTSSPCESLTSFSEISETHPFSQELQQLSEHVEELGALVEEEDEHVMDVLGLAKWSPDQYMCEIQGLSLEGETLFT